MTHRPADLVPPPGPGWFGSVMGSAILSNLLMTVGHSTSFGVFSGICHVLSPIVFAIAWGLLIVLTVGFIIRCVRDTSVLIKSITDLGQATAWGMVSMGYLAVGSATPVVIEGLGFNAAAVDTAWTVDLVFWLLATAIGTISAFGFIYTILRNQIGEPRPAWGLALVAPTVSATTGALQVPHFETMTAKVWMLIAATASFFLAVILAAIVFALAYAHAWRRSPLPLAAMPSSFIPLGIVGQSTAAAQAIAMQATDMSHKSTHNAIFAVAHVYGYLILIIGIPMLAVAIYLTIYGFRHHMPFSPSYWAMTFPVGTLCLGTYLLYKTSGNGLFHILAVCFLIMLSFNWCVAATATIRAIRRKKTAAKA